MSCLVFRTPHELIAWRKTVAPQTVGFVPTMGALHLGHEALLRQARSENQITVLSIFINPTQFNDKNDFEKYPQVLPQDLLIAEKHHIDVVFLPNFKTMYPDEYKFKLIETEFSKVLCGRDRPGHFDGVLSVVMKLFQIVQPTKAYFGEKDFQQLTLIRGMVESFFLPVEIEAVQTVREIDGLALSSRNARLSQEQRIRAPKIYETITKAKTADEAKLILEKDNFEVDYVTDLQGRRFAAVKLGDVRLIDNVKI